MKVFLFSLLFLGLVAVKKYALSDQQSIETYPYVVNKKYKDFELRTYEASLFTSVNLSSSTYKESSRQGFSILAGYIFGGNDKKEKIAMTSPVAMTLGDSSTMMFMLPKTHKRENLPTPDNSRIKIKQEPVKTVAAITFGGWADDEKIEVYKNTLLKALDKAQIPYTNKYYFFGYNPPYEMINRKNEIIITLEDGVLDHIK